LYHSKTQRLRKEVLPWFYPSPNKKGLDAAVAWTFVWVG
jgi:hypothetical protein